MAKDKHKTENGSTSQTEQSETSTADTSASNVGTAPPVDPSPDPIRVRVEDKPVEILSKIVAKEIVKRSQLNYRKETDTDSKGNETVRVVDPEPRSLYRIFGVARDRQRFQAPQCFLQGASEGLLLDALLSARKQDPSATVMFAFDIGVKPSQKWVAEDKGNSYEYTVRTVLSTQQHDPLKEIRDLASTTLPALPAPQA
jgi:hypothetical protein